MHTLISSRALDIGHVVARAIYWLGSCEAACGDLDFVIFAVHFPCMACDLAIENEGNGKYDRNLEYSGHS